MTTLTPNDVVVTGGVDTHQDLHVAAALDQLGRAAGHARVPDDRRRLPAAAGAGCGGTARSSRSGVEGTGSYGAALARHLTGAGVQVIEVARPNRQVRRRHGKTDVVDAIAAARAVLSGEATGDAQEPRRAGRGAADPEGRAAQREQGPHPGAEPDPPAAGHRTGGAARPAAAAHPQATCSRPARASGSPPTTTACSAMTRLALRELAQRVLHLDEQLAAGHQAAAPHHRRRRTRSWSPPPASVRPSPRHC